MRVGYLGPAGTFSHEALMAAPGAEAFELAPQATVHDTVLAVQEGRVDRALVPIENSLEGSVNATLDALAGETSDVAIVGELVHPVRHCLVAREPVELDAVRTVVSHAQATGQCARFIRSHLARATVIAAPSTAEAVRMVADGRLGGDGPAAALGTRLAADLYGCAVLVDGVEDEPGNATRFVWLARRGTADAPEPDVAPAGAAWKTTLVFWGAGTDAPGWLVRCLSEFAFRGINLTRIESRPRREALGRYMFFVDLEGRDADTAVADAVEGLRAQAGVVRVLGSYPAA